MFLPLDFGNILQMYVVPMWRQCWVTKLYFFTFAIKNKIKNKTSETIAGAIALFIDARLIEKISSKIVNA